MGYDSFTITALLHLEDLGFCKKGEGGPYVADGHLGPGWHAGHEHQRRRALLHPSGHVRHVPPHRGDPAAPRRVRRAPGRRGHRRRGPRLGHVPLGHVDRRPRAPRRRCEPTEPGRARAAPAPASSRQSAPRAGLTGRRHARAGCSCSGAPRATAASSTPRAFCPLAARRPAPRSNGAAPRAGAPCTPPWSNTGPTRRAPTFSDGQPYCIALVDLDEGVRMLTNVVGCPPDEVAQRHGRHGDLGAAERRAPAALFEPAGPAS